MVYSSILRGDLFHVLTLCYFVLVFFSPFSIAITSLGEERTNLSAFRTFVRFVLCLILLVSSSSWCLERAAKFVIVALPGLFSYLFWQYMNKKMLSCRYLDHSVSFSTTRSFSGEIYTHSSEALVRIVLPPF